VQEDCPNLPLQVEEVTAAAAAAAAWQEDSMHILQRVSAWAAQRLSRHRCCHVPENVGNNMFSSCTVVVLSMVQKRQVADCGNAGIAVHVKRQSRMFAGNKLGVC
jgi:hypothetical protein